MNKKKDLVLLVANEDQFMQYFDESNPKLVVLDLHPEWSGACELMNPTFKQLATNVDDFEKRIDLLSMDVEKLINYKNDKLRKIIAEVDGPNSPLLLDKIMKNIPL